MRFDFSNRQHPLPPPSACMFNSLFKGRFTAVLEWHSWEGRQIAAAAAAEAISARSRDTLLLNSRAQKLKHYNIQKNSR